MRTLLCGVALLAIVAAPAVAGARYDRKLERAVMEIVAGRIGDIRGGFSYEQAPQLVMPHDEAFSVPPAAEGSRTEEAREQDDGSKPAVEGRVSRIVF